MRYVFLRITLVAAAILLHASIGFACTCGPIVSVLDEYERSQVVLVARISSFEEVEQERKPSLVLEEDKTRARVVVEKVYKGDVRVGDTLEFAQGNGLDCGWVFADQLIGRQALMYLQIPRKGSAWRVSSCERSTFLNNAKEDLLYLDKIDQVRGKTRVSGRYTAGFYRGELSVAARKIKIAGESGTYETTTDENGFFEIYDIPAGNYRLEPELQSGLILDHNWIWFSTGPIREQSTDMYVAFTLKPQKHISIRLGFKSKDGK